MIIGDSGDAMQGRNAIAGYVLVSINEVTADVGLADSDRNAEESTGAVAVAGDIAITCNVIVGDAGNIDGPAGRVALHVLIAVDEVAGDGGRAEH